MSTEETPTPEGQTSPPVGQREITVSVPEDRVEQFQAFYERFLAIAERKGRHGHGGRGPSGRGARGGYRRRHIRRAMFHLAMAEHGPAAGHCGRGRGPAQDETTTQAPATSL